MLAFNELVFDQFTRGGVKVFTPAKFDEILGSATDLAVEIEVEEASGSTPTITVECLCSSSGKAVVTLSTLVTNGDISNVATTVYRVFVTQAGPLGKLVRLSVLIGGTSNPTARVRIWAAGRMRN